MALFGKSGGDLKVLLNSLAEDGYAKAEAKAKSLGLYLSGDMIAQVEKSHEALHTIQDAALGIATQFETGFLPPVADAT